MDDEQDALEFLRTLLEAEGYEFVAASSGAEALALLARDPPDILFVDCMMPGLNGIEFCDLVRCDFRFRHIPIILYSAYEMHQPSDLGLYDVAFVKPAEAEDLLAAVKALLQTSQ